MTGDRTLHGLTNRLGGRVAMIDADVFYGVMDYPSGFGEIITGHEIITHMMGLEHSDENYSRLTKGGTIWFTADKITPEEGHRILANLTRGIRINQGDNSINLSFIGSNKQVILPNITLPFNQNMTNFGLDTKTIIKHEKKEQSSNKNEP